MRRRLAMALLLASPVAPALAGANPEIPPGQDGGANRPMLLQFGKYFLQIAKTFGCDDFRWATFGPAQRFMSLEYVPEGADINAWTREMTITVYPLPPQADAQRDAMMKIEGGLLGAYAKGKIIDQVTYTDSKGDPRLYLEYEIGEGLQQEHNAGTFLRSSSGSAAFIQIQSRGKPFDAKDAADMKLFAQNRLPIAKN